MTLGIFGGSFNPIHLAHLRMAEVAREFLELERVLFIPAADPPHKTEDLAPARSRLEMVRLATAANPAFEVLDLELRRAGPSYSVDTLRELGSLYPNEEFWFLIGSDTLRELATWREPDTLVGLTHLAVFSRPGSEQSLAELLPEELAASFHRTQAGLEHRSGRNVCSVPFSPLDISASDIRARIGRSDSIRYLVPEAVIDYIEKHNLYREAA